MRRLSLFLAAVITLAASSCKGPAPAPCPTPAACGDGLHFRMADTGGHDLLYGQFQRLSKDSLHAWQPCAADSLAPHFITYTIPGTTDSGVVLHFANLRTPAYGETGACFRVFFRWSAADVDTLDWHYPMDDDPNGCSAQMIDYMSYNGRQARKIHDNSYDYYQLVK